MKSIPFPFPQFCITFINSFPELCRNSFSGQNFPKKWLTIQAVSPAPFCFACKYERWENSCFSWAKFGKGFSGFHQLLASDPSIYLLQMHPLSLANFRYSSGPAPKSGKTAAYSSSTFWLSRAMSAWERKVLPRCQSTLWTCSQEDQLRDQGQRAPTSIAMFLSGVINGGKPTKALLWVLFPSDDSV